jgi:oligoribonuclease
MSELEEFCHYRNLDVSSIRELGKRWYFEQTDNFQKNSNHRALGDIRDSIEELRYYRKTIFRL